MDRLWLVSGGTVAPYDGDLADYRSHVTGAARAIAARSARPTRPRRPISRREAAQRRAALEPLAKEIKNL